MKTKFLVLSSILMCVLVLFGCKPKQELHNVDFYLNTPSMYLAENSTELKSPLEIVFYSSVAPINYTEQDLKLMAVNSKQMIDLCSAKDKRAFTEIQNGCRDLEKVNPQIASELKKKAQVKQQMFDKTKNLSLVRATKGRPYGF